MSEEAVKRQMEREGWNPEHLKGVPLADLKEALAEAWVKRRGEKKSKVLLVAKNSMQVNLMKLWKWKRKISRWRLCV